jgi:hypothetical protein
LEVLQALGGNGTGPKNWPETLSRKKEQQSQSAQDPEMGNLKFRKLETRHSYPGKGLFLKGDLLNQL